MESTIGHNQPPGELELAADAAQTLNEWMAENPVIQTEEQARTAKLLVDRGKATRGDLEDAREKEVRPLNTQVAAINERYRGPRGLLDRLVGELSRRLTAFAIAEEERRIAAARLAREEAEKAERLAREAEAAEKAAIESTEAGVCGVDIAGATQAADTRFAEYEAATRTADRAERETKVRIVGGFRRSISLRSKETLFLDNAEQAIRAIPITEALREEILKAARLYRQQWGELPPGVRSETTRSV